MLLPVTEVWVWRWLVYRYVPTDKYREALKDVDLRQ